jgi:hypothetical protein
MISKLVQYTGQQRRITRVFMERGFPGGASFPVSSSGRRKSFFRRPFFVTREAKEP